MEPKGSNPTHLLEELKLKKNREIPNLGRDAEKPDLSYNVDGIIKS